MTTTEPRPFVIPMPPTFASVDDERLHRKQRLAGALRMFGRFGFGEGVAGHITCRDPERTDHFWVNPFGMSFRQIRVSDLILVNHARRGRRRQPPGQHRGVRDPLGHPPGSARRDCRRAFTLDRTARRGRRSVVCSIRSRRMRARSTKTTSCALRVVAVSSSRPRAVRRSLVASVRTRRRSTATMV